jgi:hypothetical protein
MSVLRRADSAQRCFGVHLNHAGDVPIKNVGFRAGYKLHFALWCAAAPVWQGLEARGVKRGKPTISNALVGRPDARF